MKKWIGIGLVAAGGALALLGLADLLIHLTLQILALSGTLTALGVIVLEA